MKPRSTTKQPPGNPGSDSDDERIKNFVLRREIHFWGPVPRSSESKTQSILELRSFFPPMRLELTLWLRNRSDLDAQLFVIHPNSRCYFLHTGFFSHTKRNRQSFDRGLSFFFFQKGTHFLADQVYHLCSQTVIPNVLHRDKVHYTRDLKDSLLYLFFFKPCC